MHKQDQVYIVHGDVKPASVSVCGDEENKNDLIWLITHAVIELEGVLYLDHFAYDMYS